MIKKFKLIFLLVPLGLLALLANTMTWGWGLLNVVVVALGILVVHYGRQAYHMQYRLKLLQTLQEASDVQYMMFDRNNALVYANKKPCHLTYHDFVEFLERKFTNYESETNVLKDLRLLRDTEGLVQRKKDEHVFSCTHKVFAPDPYHMVLLKELTNPHMHQWEKRCKELEDFVKFAGFGLIYTTPDGQLIGSNLMGRTFLGDRPVEKALELGKIFQIQNDKLIYHLASSHAYLVIPYDPVFFQSHRIQAFWSSCIPAAILDAKGQIIDTNQSMRQHTDWLTPVRQKGLGQRAPYELGHHMVYTTQLDHGQYLVQLIDISEQKQLEQQFIQSQKMQAIGQLAGGIAHDFNNLLTAIIGYCDLLLQRFVSNDPSYTDLIQIKQNAHRASNLVKQLLAFARQQHMKPKVIYLTDVLSDTATLLKRLLGPSIQLRISHGQNLWFTKADHSQIEQVLINLAVNARDAMQNEGTLTIATSNYTCTHPLSLGHETMQPGEYVRVDVSDTGGGILPEHLEHIFEPFFSTKGVGSTGLGLSTVYGIIKQSNGYVTVQSSQSGTTFTLYLPRHEGELAPSKPVAPEIMDLTGQGKILLIEDEDAVRTFAARALREKGYDVFEASGADTAIDWVQKGHVFDLVITDIVMPKMDGPTLVKQLRSMDVTAQIIFISGYSEDTFHESMDLDDPRVHFLSKPFNVKDLAQKVKQILPDAREAVAS